MNARIVLTVCVSLVVAPALVAGYTTPNTGVQWTLDSLVAYSAGTLTGTFPGYTMADTITIAVNDRVTIAPGSIITVTQGAGKGFTVFGVLRAIGTVTDSIIVKGSVDSAGWHRGFRFDETSVDSLCVISYCRIMNAVDAVYCFNASPLISHSLFTKNSTNGVRCFGASPTVRNCVFLYNRQSAITATVNSSPLIENNLFAHNNYQNTGARNAIAIGGQGVNNPVIRGNEIYNQHYFRAGAISLVTLTGSDVCNAIVENNYLHGNSFGIVVQGLSPGGTLQPVIRYNRIERNRINPDPLISGSGITVQTGGPSNAPIITGNLLKENYWGITIVSSSGLGNSPKPVIGDLSNADTSDDGWNVFENNNNGGIIYQLYNNGTQDISAQNNYWNTDDSSTVESWVYHRPDSTVFGIADYMPIGHKGLGKADSFVVQPFGQQIMLRWKFPYRSYKASIHLHYSTDGVVWFVLGTFPDSVESFVTTPPSIAATWFRLGSATRFGVGPDTSIIYPGPISVQELPGIPTEFCLKQNYPNPFNPTTTIEFHIPQEGFTELKLFDILGREMQTLIQDRLAAGRHRVAVDASRFSSGVYFYRLEAGGSVATRRLVLLK